jgi:hypothetical protein
MFLEISPPRVDPGDPDYVRMCQKALEEPSRDMLDTYASAIGSRTHAAATIATELAFPAEMPRAAIYLEMLGAGARSAGWADFAIKAALPTAIAKVVEEALRDRNEHDQFSLGSTRPGRPSRAGRGVTRQPA